VKKNMDEKKLGKKMKETVSGKVKVYWEGLYGTMYKINDT
jgi:hypothetical protein